MPIAISSFTFADSSRALLRAIGIPENLHGAVPALTAARYCFEQAEEVWGEPLYAEWGRIARELEQTLREAGATEQAASQFWHSPVPDRNSPAARLADLPCPLAPGKAQQRLSALTGRALVTASIGSECLANSLLVGVHTLFRAATGNGRRSVDWQALIDHDGLDAASLRQRVEALGPKSPALPFAVAALKTLETAVAPPKLLDHRPAGELTTKNSIEKPLPRVDKQSGRTPSNGRNGGTAAERSPMDLTPNIAGRFVAAEAGSVAEKLGFHCRDYLLPGDLAPITRQLDPLLDSPDPSLQAFSALALTSLITACSDSIAVNLRFEPKDSIWLDLDRGTWCWDFAEYRRHTTPGTELRAREPIANPLPMRLATVLGAARVRFPTALTLGGLINGIMGMGAALDLDRFREFLKNRGGTAHPPYRGRFARSLVYVYLQVTGSDMTAASLTGQFACCAPAALFYLGLTQQTRYDRAARVYGFLGLGEPSPPSDPNARIGCQKVLERADLTSGWEALVADSRALLGRLQAARQSEVRSIATELMQILGAAFVIQTAHRGTRLECLTFGALFLHPEAIAILDKDEGGRHPSRLLPKTNQVEQILAASAECHRAVRATSDPEHQSSDPVFVRWESDADGGAGICLSTSTIAAVMRRYFGDVDHNFARSAWVTHLDESGCDRWLIRVLTGHTRDVTRTSGAYFDVPPIVFAKRLKTQMDHVGCAMFGENTIVCESAPPFVKYKIRSSADSELKPSFRVADPRSLLDEIDEATLGGWRSAARVRDAIASGRIGASAGVCAVLSMIFLDFLPDAQLCLNAVTKPDQFLRRHGRQCGVLWHRSHFTHPTWIPIDSTTERFIELARTERLQGSNLVRAIRKTLYRIDASWSKRGSGFTEVERVLRQFLRIELPPSLQAMALPNTPAPALSELSLIRLSQGGKQAPIQASDLPPDFWRAPTAKTTDRDLLFLRKTVHVWTTNVERSGELQKRAVQLRKQIKEGFIANSMFSSWVCDWIIDELDQSAAMAKGRLDVSSIYTYLCVLITRSPELADLDPYEWAQEEWNQWIDVLDASVSGTPPAAPGLQEDVRLHPAVKHAVGRLARSLARRGYDVPWDVRQRLFDKDDPQPCGSASSTVLLDADLSAAMEICMRWLEGNPLDQLLIQSRIAIHKEVPSRTSEPSSLALDCLTPSRALVIERMGYKVHKTDNAIRLVLLSDPLYSEIDRLRGEVAKYHPDGASLFLRGDGSLEAGRRDVYLTRLLSLALKIASGDTEARLYSMRARALQKIAWPGWTELSQRMLRSGVSVEECVCWTSEAQQFWARLALASVQAGHGDLRPALGNYVAAWPLVLRIHARAMLSQLTPGRALLSQLDVKPNTFAQAYARSGHVLSMWDWLDAHLPRSPLSASESLCDGKGAPRVGDTHDQEDVFRAEGATLQGVLDTSEEHESHHERRKPAERTPAPAVPRDRHLAVDETGSDTAKPPVQASRSHADGALSSSEVAYLTALVLGVSKPRALEYSAVNLTTANRLDLIAPSTDLMAWAVKRARSQPQPRGEAANIDLLTSSDANGAPVGLRIIQWVARVSDRSTLYRIIFRRAEEPPSRAQITALWRELASELPSFLSLLVHRSPRHLDAKERTALQDLQNLVALKEDPEIGALPLVKLYPRGSGNRVLSSRYTSVFRAAVAGCAAIEKKIPLTYD